MAYNPYRASYGLPPPTLPSPGKPVPQGMAPVAQPAPPPLAPLRIKNPQVNMSTSRNRSDLNNTIRSSNRSAVSILPEDFRPENLLGDGLSTNKQQREAMEAFNPERIKEIKGSRRAQNLVSKALAAAGAGSSPSAPESSPPARTVASNPRSKNGSTESLFGGLSPIAKVNNNQRKRKSRKLRRSRKQFTKSRKVKKHYK